jgi:hypothetical protein
MNIQSKIYTRKNDSGTHYARIILAKELRAFAIKAAVWRSLSTKDDTEARKAGVVTTVAARLVFQEMCDSCIKDEKAVVVVDTELVGKKIDLDAVAGEVVAESLLPIVESLRASFGISTKGTGPSGKSSGGGSNTPVSSNKSRSSKAGKVANKKSATGKPTSSIPAKPVPPSDDEVLRYIEKRPHGCYRFRYWIPRPLQKMIGQREIRRTLETKDRAVAIQAARPIFMELREVLLRYQNTNCSAGIINKVCLHKMVMF